MYDKTNWVKRTDRTPRHATNHTKAIYGVYRMGNEIFAGTLPEISKEFNLSHSSLMQRSLEYDAFEVDTDNGYSKKSDYDYLRIAFKGMKDCSSNWVERKDRTKRYNSCDRKHMYGVYLNDEYVFEGTYKEICEFLNRSPNYMGSLVYYYDVFEIKNDKGVKYQVAYLGVEEMEEAECSMCHKVKPLNEFVTHKFKGEVRHQPLCKECRREMGRYERRKKL